MIELLHIENLAIIQNLDIPFQNGFSVITGETGAGKSIIIEALKLLFGNKGDKQLIRNGADSIYVNAILSGFSENIIRDLSQMNILPDEEGCIFVERTFDLNGKSTVRINNRVYPISTLKEFSTKVLSMHQQSDNYSALNKDKYSSILDGYIDDKNLYDEYQKLYNDYLLLNKKIKSIQELTTDKDKNLDLLKYQIKEIELFHPKIDEEDQLKEKLNLLKNKEKINQYTGFIYKALSANDKNNVQNILTKVSSALSTLEPYIKNSKELQDKIEESINLIVDVSDAIYPYVDSDDDQSLDYKEKIESRLSNYIKMHKKYGETEEILQYYDKLKKQIETIENAEDELASLLKEKNKISKKMESECNIIHEKRIKAADLLHNEILNNLKFLDLPSVKFSIPVEIQKDSLGQCLFDAKGFDKVSFMFSMNEGEPEKDVSEIASGGEIARILLAIESVISEKANISTIIFDEIDTGVSGKSSRKIGFQMLKGSKNSQIIAITHSAQIASLADHHLFVAKRSENGQTFSSIKELSREERVHELARILGGIQISDTQLNAALSLLDNREYSI